MNYIKQINFFWDKARRHSLGAGEIAMYMYLLHVSNAHDWENPVMEPNATLQHAIGVKSFNTLKEIRNRLQQTGLLRFKSRNGSSVVEYDLFDADTKTFSKNEKVTDEVGAKVTAKVVAEVGDKVGNSVLLDNKQKPKPKEEKRAQVQILEPEEIKNRLIEQEYQVREFICRTYQFSDENYCAAVEVFVGEKTSGNNELEKDYAEVLSFFKSWVKAHSQKLKKLFENGKANTTGQGRNGHSIGNVVNAADRILAEASGQNNQ